MFSPEKPITSASQDVLGRLHFAKSLSKSINGYQSEDSIVIGLFGPWGSGKSSLTNLILEDIRVDDAEKNENEKNIIVNFNPWNYSDQNQLVTQFFNSLSKCLKLSNHSEDAINAGQKLEAYAKFFNPLSLIPETAIPATFLSKLFSFVGHSSKGWGEANQKSLHELKEDLNNHLSKIESKIIIVIDDIDRLNNIEIRQIFQLIKSLGDFPNTVYLVAFDKNIVVNALKKVQEGSGEEYLEKMVQIPFEIPPISKVDIENLLFSEINKLIADIPKNKFDQTYWGNMYHSGIKYFFNNLRDVTRFINSLRFGFNMIKYEVNTVDFIALTCFQVFIPNLYSNIRSNKELFSGVYYGFGDNSKKIETDKLVCETILEKVPLEYSDFILEMLSRMFPKLKGIYGNTTYGSDWLGSWRKDGRICSKDKFDIYFKLQIPQNDISIIEIDDIIINDFSEEKFQKSLIHYSCSERLPRFLELLEDYTSEDINIENVESILKIILNLGDTFPKDLSGIFGENNIPIRIRRITKQLLKRFNSKDERYEILNRVIDNTHLSISTIVECLVMLGYDHGKLTEKPAKPLDEHLISLSDLEKLEKKVSNMIKEWFDTNKLSNTVRPVYLLYRLSEWESSINLKEFIVNLISNDLSLIEFLESCLNRSVTQGMGDYVGSVNWSINLKTISELLDVDVTNQRLVNFKASDEFNDIDERLQLTVNIFLDTYSGKIKDDF